MFCLGGIGAPIPGMIKSTKTAKRIIAIDGCPVSCAKETPEHAGFNVTGFNLQDMGFEKGRTKVDESSIVIAWSHITEENKSEETAAHSSGSRCAGQ